MSADDVRQWAFDVRAFAGEAPRRSADAAAEVVERVLASDSGGDGALRNAPWGAATVSVEDWGREEAAVMASGSMGVWTVLEAGTRGHRIWARGRALITPYGPRRFVDVEGMSAKGTWTKGKAGGLAVAEREADAAFDGKFG